MGRKYIPPNVMALARYIRTLQDPDKVAEVLKDLLTADTERTE